MASAFPKLPGYVPTHHLEKTSFKRVSANLQEKLRDPTDKKAIVYPLPRQVKPDQPDQTGALNQDYMSTTHSTFKATSGTLENPELYKPSWVILDKHVLRFYGFFKESVTESAKENHRVRLIQIFFYLEDGSISATEPKLNNSGIPQGPFLKRQKVIKPNAGGQFFSIYDLRIGQEILLFGKNVLVYDCDQYSREFYDNLGLPQDAPFEPPSDTFLSGSQTKYVPVRDTMMKDYLEHKLGGGRVKPAKQFLENDRRVLKFYVYSGIPYIMHYYLADDTIDIREVKYANSGRDPFPLMLKRQRLPRKFSLNQPGQSSEESYITPDQIKHGESLEVFGRKFFIKGCDPFTQEFYKERYSTDFPIGSVEPSTHKEGSNIIIPPHNGFGDEEDSLGYVYRLIPKPPKKDYFKWMDNQAYLRFHAKLNTTKPEDVDRRFIITFFLHDDNILVYEPGQRNSGIVEGKFLEKGKYKNVEQGNIFFVPEDFVIGKDMVINGYSFRLLDMDEFSRKWYEFNSAQNETMKQTYAK
jgi:hypothetical protein